MTWRLAKPKVIEKVEGISRTYQTGKFGSNYKHQPDWSEYIDEPNRSLGFYLFTPELQTDDGDWILGHERTLMDVTLRVFLSTQKANPHDFDTMVGQVYEEVRNVLLDESDVDTANTTLMHIFGPGGGHNIPMRREDELSDDGRHIGSWLTFDLAVEHEEQGS